MECAPIRAQAWLDTADLDFGGLRLDAVVALIERAGLSPRVVPYAGGSSAEEQRADRVTLRLTEAGELAAVEAG